MKLHSSHRSLLFVPASRPDRFDKALASGASRVVIDLEDAVAPNEKDHARAAVRGWLTPVHDVILRINGADTPWFAADLALCGCEGVGGVMLPKAEQTEPLASVMRAGAKSLLPLVETAAGFASLDRIAKAPGVACLAFGSLDLQADLGMRDPREEELLPFRVQMVLAARLAGIAPPIDGVSTATEDESRLQEDALRARRLGFGGKLCIHPRQVSIINLAFAPSAREVTWARRVLELAAAAHGAVFALDGKMVDRPVILRAEAIVREDAATDSEGRTP